MSPISIFSSVYNKSNQELFDIIILRKKLHYVRQPKNRRMDQRGRNLTAFLYVKTT